MFSKNPLKEFIDKNKNHKQKNRIGKRDNSKFNKIERSIFVSLILIFVVGIAINLDITPTGLVTYDDNVYVESIGESYTNNTTLNISSVGIIKSVRISGFVSGYGEGVITLGNYTLINSSKLDNKNTNLITGNVISELNNSEEENKVIEEVNQTDDEQIIIELIEEQNVTIENEETEEEIIEQNTTIKTNETIKIIENETIDFVEKNETISINETEVNDTVEINTTIETNETIENIEQNETEQFVEPIEQETKQEYFEAEFLSYCEETCNIIYNGSLELEIKIDNVTIQIDRIVYITGVVVQEPVVNETIENETIPVELNETIIVQNETIEQINQTQNITTNLTQNLTLNLTQNITQNITTNVTLNITINQTQNISQNITLNITTLTDEEKFNLKLKQRGLFLEKKEFKNGKYDLLVSDKESSVEFSVTNLSKADVRFLKHNDKRLSSKIFYLKINKTKVKVKGKPDVVLECVQFEEEICKRWKKTNIKLNKINGTTEFSTEHFGVYTTAKIKQKEIWNLPSETVSWNSNCAGCVETYSCNNEYFCTLQNGLDNGRTHMAQLDFDIFELTDKFARAEICAYQYYPAKRETTIELKLSSESFCSDIRYENLTSEITLTGTISNEKTWNCMDATELIRNSQNQGYSNVFINWFGEDANNGKEPLNCYIGIGGNRTCGEQQYHEQTDCRPYLKITYDG